jgi:hypothetical protein
MVEVAHRDSDVASASTETENAEISAVDSTASARNFCEMLQNNVNKLTGQQCKILLAMADSGRELRVVAKAASRIWGGEFDGGTAEIAGPTLFRQLLRRSGRFDEVHRPEFSEEFMGDFDGYRVHFLKPDFVYRVQGKGLNRFFSPRYMPVSGMDIEDVMNVLNIIGEHEV